MKNFTNKALTLLFFALLLVSSYSHDDHDEEFHCIHDKVEKFPLVFDEDPKDPSDSDHGFLSHSSSKSDPQDHPRTLQTTTSRKIRFRVAYDFLTPTQSVYIRTLMTSVIDYFQRLLNVSDSIVLRKLTATNIYCSLVPPTNYSTIGFSEDMLLFVTDEANTMNYVASAQACAVIGTTRKPYVARITLNTNYLKPSTNQITTNGHITAIMHEMFHALGFSSTLIPYYPNPNKTTSSKPDNGFTRSYINIGKPLLGLQDEIQSYFGCYQNLSGALFEQQGGVSTAGSHWERRIFNNEIMTANLVRDMIVTNFTLKFMENTGWYTVNYSFAHPTFYGKGKGCKFIEGNCYNTTSKTTAYPNEFCSNIGAKLCTTNRKQGAACGTARSPPFYTYTLGAWDYFATVTMDDPFADNCPTKMFLQSKDCEDPTSTRLTYEYIGRDSRCFVGTIYSTGAAYTTNATYCLRHRCNQISPGVWTLTYFIRTVNATCTAAGRTTVPGYPGWLECPDPNQFCNQEGVQHCRHNCFGRGVCNYNFGNCTCDPGFNGTDCSGIVV